MYLQHTGTSCADKRADCHVNVGGATLSTVEALPVAADLHQLPQCLQILVILFFAHHRHVPFARFARNRENLGCTLSSDGILIASMASASLETATCVLSVVLLLFSLFLCVFFFVAFFAFLFSLNGWMNYFFTDSHNLILTTRDCVCVRWKSTDFLFNIQFSLN